MLLGCAAGPPRVLEVSHLNRTATVGEVDEALFVADRASHIPVPVRPLPVDEQAQEFYVRWSSRAVREVRFQYRQVNVPGAVKEMVFHPERQSATRFRIAGEAFVTGGPVSAWRVTLWQAGDAPVAEMKSVLW